MLTTCTPGWPIFNDSGSSVQDTNRCDYIDQNVCPSFQELRTELPHNFVESSEQWYYEKHWLTFNQNTITSDIYMKQGKKPKQGWFLSYPRT